jgi:general stress protein 26
MGGHTSFRATACGSTEGSITGGSPKTVHYRNITHNPHVAVHIGDGQEAIIVEGAVEIEKPTEKMAARLSDESFAKYPQYGRLEPSLYMGGVSVLRPRRLLAWTTFTENATRFKFE